MMNKFLLILVIAFLLTSCNSGNTVSDGEGSSTEVVIGLIVDSVGEPVEGAVVSLYPSDYNPVVHNGEGRLTDTSDQSGLYEFEIQDSGAYFVVCKESGEGKRGAMTHYSSPIKPDTTFDTLVILAMVEKTIAVSETTVDTVSGYIYIPGTDYVVPVEEATKSNGNINFTIDAMPQGEAISVNLSSTVNPDNEEVIAEDVTNFVPFWYKVLSKDVDPLSQITHMVEDSTGAFWFGNDFSILKLEDNGIWKQYDIASGDLISKVFDMDVDKSGNLWVTHSLDGISYFDGTDWKRYDSLTFNPIGGARCVTAQSADTVWFGNLTGHKGPFRYVKSTDSWTSVKITDNVANNGLFDIQYKDGNLWAATTSGCAEYNGTDWNYYASAVMGIGITYPENLAITSGGGAWFSSDSGMTHYDGFTWTNYTPSNSDLQSNKLNELALDTEGRMYVASPEKGVLSYYGGDWTEHSSDKGTPPSVDDSLDVVTVDSEGNIWACGKSGVFVMGPTAGKYSK